MRPRDMIGSLLVAALVLVQGSSSDVLAGSAPPADLKARAEAVVTLDRNGPDPDAPAVTIGDAFGRIGESELEPTLLASYDTRTLEIVFDAVAIASERLRRPDLLKTIADIFEACLKRGFVGKMVARLHLGYVHERDWENARELCESFPSHVAVRD